MNNFEKQIQKFKELKKNGKDVYLKSIDENGKVENLSKIIDYEINWTFKKVIFFRNSFMCIGFNFEYNSFEILNEEEYLKEQKNIIENRLVEIEEEKKPKIEIGKTYVIRRKGTESDISFCLVRNIIDSKFCSQTPIAIYRKYFQEYDFQEVDISIKEFFENQPHKYWKNS